MPLLMAKQEVFAWLKAGTKTIDVRKGCGRRGEIAVFQCGPNYIRFCIVKRETGKLTQLVRADNYRHVVPSAENLQAALNYLQALYGSEAEFFTAYYLGEPKV